MKLTSISGFVGTLICQLPFTASIQAAETSKIVVPAGPEMTLWKMLEAAGWVMIPLLAVSFVASFLIIYLIMTIRPSRVINSDLKKSLEDKIRAGKWDEVLETARKSPLLTSRVMEASVSFMKSNPEAGFDSIREVAQAEGARQVTQLNQQVVYLMDVGVLSPMLGLFGTVVGILRSFGSIANDSAAVAMRATLLAGGVSQALVATAVGLIVGITAMFFYSYFRGRAQGLISELETSSTALVALMGIHFKKRD